MVTYQNDPKDVVTYIVLAHIGRHNIVAGKLCTVFCLFGLDLGSEYCDRGFSLFVSNMPGSWWDRIFKETTGDSEVFVPTLTFKNRASYI